MFVTNSFDSILAAIGVDAGGFNPNVDPLTLALSIIGGGIAMGVFSAAIGVYLSERAERLKELRDLERKVQASLRDSIYWYIARLAPVYIALWSGFGAILFPITIAVPYLVAVTNYIPVKLAYASSLAIAFFELGFLGLYLAKVSGDSKLKSIARTVLAGLGGLVLVTVLRDALHIAIAP